MLNTQPWTDIEMLTEQCKQIVALSKAMDKGWVHVDEHDELMALIHNYQATNRPLYWDLLRILDRSPFFAPEEDSFIREQLSLLCAWLAKGLMSMDECKEKARETLLNFGVKEEMLTI